MISAYRQIDGDRIPVFIRGDGVIKNIIFATNFKYSTAQHPVRICFIGLPNSNIPLEHIIHDRLVKIDSVHTRYRERESVLRKIDGLIRHFQFAKVIVSKGKVCRSSNSICIGGKNFNQGILGKNTDAFSSVETEHKALTNTRFKGELVHIPTLSHLLDFDRSRDAVILNANSCLHDRSVLILIRQSDRVNGIVLGITFDRRDFLNGISTKFQKPGFGITVLIRGKSGDGFTRSILYFKNTACKPFIGKLWRIHSAIIRAAFDNSSHQLNREVPWVRIPPAPPHRPCLTVRPVFNFPVILPQVLSFNTHFSGYSSPR